MLEVRIRLERLEVNLGELGSSLSLCRSARKLKLPSAQWFCVPDEGSVLTKGLPDRGFTKKMDFYATKLKEKWHLVINIKRIHVFFFPIFRLFCISEET